MKLIRLTGRNYRCLKEIDLTLSSLTVLIGENDAGKSSCLDLLDLCLSGSRPDDRDFYRDQSDHKAEIVEAILEFTVEDSDEDAYRYALDGLLRVKYTFSQDGAATLHYWHQVPEDTRLAQDFNKLTAEAQRELIQSLDPAVVQYDISNATKRAAWLTNYRNVAPKCEEWIPTPPKWNAVLPRFERYSSMDYNAPERMIEKTLKQVYEETIFEPDPNGTSTRRLIEPLRQVEEKAGQRIRDEVGKLSGHIQRYNSKVDAIDYEPRFDFASAIRTGEFRVNTGRGLHALTRTGAGTRRRMFMGILDWDREVSVAQATASERLPPIIRGYDEPDANLHYDAQRRMYQTIADIVGSDNSRVQAILCTHSLTMIDRAPAQDIRLLRLNDEGHTVLDRLDTGGDPAIEHFLRNIAREMGISNSIVFYERCFVLIEGQTEENALPILYRRIYRRSLLEDGIRIINVNGNGAVKEFLKLLCRNRKELTLIFLDRDITETKTGSLTEAELRNAGFDDAFIQSHVIYIGVKEFEDAFCNMAYVGCLNTEWPGDTLWIESDIESLRSETKFSKAISDRVWERTQKSCSKPLLGQRLAENCEPDQIPQEVRTLFSQARSIAGI